MSGGSSSAAEWFTRLEPAAPIEELAHRADDPRLGQVVQFWQGDPQVLRPGRAVLVGFPTDEGVRRNHGRPGAALAPGEIRRWLYRFTAWDPENDINLAEHRPLDAGNIRITGPLEENQQALGAVVAGLLAQGAVPIVLGGGHETAFGHYLGYAAAGRRVGIINIDAHLDVRPCPEGQGHSGSPFRQAMEHSEQPLPGNRYVCLGAGPHAVIQDHLRYALDRGCVICWYNEVQGRLGPCFQQEVDRLAEAGCQVYVSIDADVVHQAEVPGVSAPNPLGVSGAQVIDCARLAGLSPHVSSLDLVEISPRHDRDGQSARWAALLVWHFLAGLAGRQAS